MANRDEAPASGSLGRLGLAETGDTVAGLPLAAVFEEGHTLKTFENTALGSGGAGGGAKAAMLRHKTNRLGSSLLGLGKLHFASVGIKGWRKAGRSQNVRFIVPDLFSASLSLGDLGLGEVGARGPARDRSKSQPRLD